MCFSPSPGALVSTSFPSLLVSLPGCQQETDGLHREQTIIYSVDLTGFSNWFLLAAFLECSGCHHCWGEAIPAAAGCRQNEVTQPPPAATHASPLQGAHSCSTLQVPRDHPFGALSLHPASAGQQEPNTAPLTRSPRCTTTRAALFLEGAGEEKLAQSLKCVLPSHTCVARTQSLPLADSFTAHFFHQPGGFQNYTVHAHEQCKTKPSPANRLSPGLSAVLLLAIREV